MLVLMTRKQEEPTQERSAEQGLIRDKKGVTFPQRGQYLKKAVPIRKDNVLRLIAEASVLL